jgi:hypothetical protein
LPWPSRTARAFLREGQRDVASDVRRSAGHDNRFFLQIELHAAIHQVGYYPDSMYFTSTASSKEPFSAGAKLKLSF